VNASRAFRHRHALHPVNPGFKFELGVGALPFDIEDGFPYPAEIGFAQGQQIGLPTLQLAVARVHLEEIAGEERGLFTARASANFHDRAGIVRRILGQQQQLNVALQGGETFA
jgi:hypothetical protein